MPLNFYTDTGGPIGRTVTDVATVFGALPGPDALDSMTDLLAVYDVTIPDNYTQFLDPAGLEARAIFFVNKLAFEKFETEKNFNEFHFGYRV